MEVYLLLFIAGVVAGFAAGLFGIGGGVILVPMFNYFFSYLGVPEELGFKISVATSLAVITVSTLFTSGVHVLSGKVDLKELLKLLPWILVGILLGVLFSHFVSGHFLKKIFGLFLLLLSFKLITDRSGAPKFSFKENVLLPAVLFLSAFSSALLGIGGGVVVNTLLFSLSQIETKRVVALASTISFINAFLGTILYMFVPAHKVLSWQLGYVYIPAAFFVALGGIIGSRLGLKLLHRINQHLLRRIFGFLLILIGLKMLIK